MSPTKKQELEEKIETLKISIAATTYAERSGLHDETIQRFQKNWKEEILSLFDHYLQEEVERVRADELERVPYPVSDGNDGESLRTREQQRFFVSGWNAAVTVLKHYKFDRVKELGNGT